MGLSVRGDPRCFKVLTAEGRALKRLKHSASDKRERGDARAAFRFDKATRDLQKAQANGANSAYRSRVPARIACAQSRASQ
jgi:hypothetical protein